MARTSKQSTSKPTSVSPDAGSSRRTNAWTGLLLLLLAFALFGNALTNPFIIDDIVIVNQDIRVTDGRLGELALGGYWPPSHKDALYRPLVKLSYAVNWSISSEPWTFRLPNLLLHAATAFAVFLLAREVLGSVRVALLTSVLFAVHPVHTEVLNAVVGRADLGAACFGLFGVLLFVRQTNNRETSFTSIIGGIALLFAALLCKESALPLVVLIPLIDVARQWKKPTPAAPRLVRQRFVRCYLPLACVLVAYFGVRYAALGGVARSADAIALVDNVIANVDEVLQPDQNHWLARWGTPVAVFARSVRLLVWPHPLSWDYSYAAIEPVRRWTDPGLMAGIALIAAALFAGIRSFSSRRHVFLSLTFWLLPYLLVANVLVLIGTIFAERLLYLPSVGFCMLVGLAVDAAVRHLRDRQHALQRMLASFTVCVFAFAAAAFAWLTIDRNRDWQSRDRLNSIDLAKHPRSVRLLCAVADDELHAGQLDDALARVRTVLEVDDDYPTAWSISGVALAQKGEVDRALLALQKALAIGAGGNEEAILTMGNLLASRGHYEESIPLLKQHVATYPLASAARNNLAWQLINAEPPDLRDPQEALRQIETALIQRPDEWALVDTYADVLLALGERDRAIGALQDLLAKMPADDPHRNDLLTKIDTLRQQ